MDFLVDAIFKVEDSSFCGANITHFDETKMSNRPASALLDLNAFKANYGSMKPMGFRYDDKTNTLFSDNQNRTQILSKVADYLIESSDYKLNSEYNEDITDVMLKGIECGAAVCVNYKFYSSETEEPILIKFSKFKVSNSSFNIYAPYRRNDEYAVYSLLNLEDGSAKPFVCMIPVQNTINEVSLFEMLSKWSEEGLKAAKLPNETINNIEYYVFNIDVGLLGYSNNYGEAFAHFLSYSYTLFDTGIRVMNELINFNEESHKEHSATKRERKPPRKPKYNVAIEHIYYGKVHLRELLLRFGKKDEALSYIQLNPDAQLTQSCLDTLMADESYRNYLKKAIENKENNAILNAFKAASKILIADYAEYALAYSLELLSLRYYLYRVGCISDPIGYTLKGGGVSGYGTVSRINN